MINSSRDLRRASGSLYRSRTITYACFLAPALILYMLVVIIPFFQGIPYSFTNWQPVKGVKDFVGMRNYVNLFSKTGKVFRKSVLNTFEFTAYYIVISNVLGLAMALLVQRSSRLNNLCRTLIFMPYVLSLITAAFVWRWPITPVLCTRYFPVCTRWALMWPGWNPGQLQSEISRVCSISTWKPLSTLRNLCC